MADLGGGRIGRGMAPILRYSTGVQRRCYTCHHTPAPSMKITRLLAAALVAGTPALAHAQLTNSPAGGTLPGGISVVGGVVADLVGLNNRRVVSQLSASSLFTGFATSNPQLIGTQTGFGPIVTNALGGGLLRASFRFTLFDGDTGPGNFDFNENFLLVNGVTVGNWSNVVTQQTTATGTLIGGTQMGFENSQLHTGFFDVTNAGQLSGIFSGMTTNQSLVFALSDVDPFDNFYDFKQGIDQGLINVGQPPSVVPEPSTYVLMAAGMAGLLYARRKRQA